MICVCLTCKRAFRRAPSLIGAQTWCDRACFRLRTPMPEEERLFRRRASKKASAQRRRDAAMAARAQRNGTA